jgi:short-subunit dehydrogenase
LAGFENPLQPQIKARPSTSIEAVDVVALRLRSCNARKSSMGTGGVMDVEHYGPWALIAGGSEGLGASFATQLAESGFNVILVGRKVAELDETAESVVSRGAQARVLSLDLTAPDMMERVRAVTDDVEVGLLICNAGANGYGSVFVDSELEKFQTVIDVNTTSRLALVHHFGRSMKERARGGILLVGSFAGYRGSPYNGPYNAVKAFGRVFAEGLWFELKPFNVDVVEFVVGGMRTPAMARKGMKFGPEVADPAVVAVEGLAHLADGPVWNSEIAGGQTTAEHLSAYPRGPIVAEAAEGLRNLGLYG